MPEPLNTQPFNVKVNPEIANNLENWFSKLPRETRLASYFELYLRIGQTQPRRRRRTNGESHANEPQNRQRRRRTQNSDSEDNQSVISNETDRFPAAKVSSGR